MSREEFNKQLALAVSFNQSLPAWKQNILLSCSSPTVLTPRIPVDNFRTQDQSDTSLKSQQQ
jgi:hypothetical protein